VGPSGERCAESEAAAVRIPLAKYGLREMIVGAGACLVAAAVCALLWWPLVALPVAACILLISFFRDPVRPCGGLSHELLSPADGVVMDVDEVAAPAPLEGRAVRIAVFMSIFNVHVNRSPTAATVRHVSHSDGKFHDARNELSATENEHNMIGLEAAGGRRILVNQIAGAVARRIVCPLEIGDTLARGERVGMVKFGSRVELFVPLEDRPTVRVKVGDRVKAGRDVVAAYPGPPSES